MVSPLQSATSMMDVPSVPEISVDGIYVREEAKRLEETDLATDDDLTNLKALTEKLRLETRRPSYLEWKARLKVARFNEPESQEDLDFQEKPEGREEVCHDPSQSKRSSGVLKGFGNLDEALKWLKRELVNQEFNQFSLKRQNIFIVFQLYDFFSLWFIFCFCSSLNVYLPLNCVSFFF